MKRQREFGAGWADAFNLASEQGIDPERLERERREEDKRAFEAWQYQKKMQRTFEQCPGYIGCDVPAGPGCKGKVVIDPAHTLAGVAWLKRRFVVNENLELSRDDGLVVEVVTKRKSSAVKTYCAKLAFAKPLQFELQL